MGRILRLATLLAATTAATGAPQAAAAAGRWVCLPDRATAPQVLVDLAERVYRRCDQSTCASYDILAVERRGGATEIAFAPGALMHIDDDDRYTEVVKRGDRLIAASGQCTFHADTTSTEGDRKEPARRDR